jgi:gamma-glutamyltranspeptidase/glutathione hydrolase
MEKARNVILPKAPASVLYSAAVAGESTAVLAARDVLARDGSAADAAVALYFTLAVTFPSQAGLGAGGVCLVHDPRSGRVEALDFPAVPAAAPGRDGETVAVPGVVRGMAYLHARYGRLPWLSLLSPAADNAREGVTTSKAFVTDLQSMSSDLANDSAALSLFFNRLGEPVGAGVIFQQIELGAVLGQIGARGAGYAYRGALADRTVEAALAIGQNFSPSDFDRSTPKWSPAVEVAHKNFSLYFPPTAGGKVAADMWRQLGTVKVTAATIDQRIAEAGNKAYVGYTGAEIPEIGTGFSVADGTGRAVACSVGTRRKFGTAKFLRGLGFSLAPSAAASSLAESPYAPVLAVNKRDKTFIFAASGAGGSVAPSATVNVAARVLLAGMPLKQASDAPRVHQGGFTPDVIKEGNGRMIGRVNAVYCLEGLPPESTDNPPCKVEADKRGFGVGAQFIKDRKR